jgi:predicted O-methyltransferase YrrM
MGTKIENEIKKIIKITRKIGGWLSNQEGYFLYQLAKGLPQKAVIVEIGSWKGKSAVWLLNGIKNDQGAVLFSVDPHFGAQKNNRQKVDTYTEFEANILQSGLRSKVKSILKTSKEASKEFNKNIDLLFIDGSHKYETVQQDFLAWSPKLNPGGWVVFHDATTLPGPWKVSRNNILLTGRFGNTGMVGSMVYGQYTNPKHIGQKAKNSFQNLLTCLFISLYAKMRKIPFPRNWRNKIRKINLKREIKRLSNV